MTNDTRNVQIPLNLTLPTWASEALRNESRRNGVEIEAIVKMWLIERLDAVGAPLSR